MLPTKYRVNWPLSSEEAQNWFSRWPPSQPSWITDRNYLNYFFLSTSHPTCFLPSFESIALLVQEKKLKIDFQDGCHGNHLGFWIRTILAVFYLQVSLIPPTKFRGNWLFGSQEVQNRSSKSPPWRPSWILDWSYFSCLWSTSHPDTSYRFFSQMAKKFKIDFQDGRHGAHLGRLDHSNFCYIWSTIHPDVSFLKSFESTGPSSGEVTLMLPTKFQVNWPLGSGEEVQNRFSKWTFYPREVQ